MIIRLLITALSAFLLQKILGGVQIESFWVAIIFAIVLGLFNMVINPILQFLGLPLTILTLGLFSLVINAAVVFMAGNFIDGMQIDGFGSALVFSILLSVLTSLFSRLLA